MYSIGYFSACRIEYHLEYPVVEYLTENRLCNKCIFWVWDPHEENQEPRRIALQLPCRMPHIPPLYTLKSFIYPIEYHPKQRLQTPFCTIAYGVPYRLLYKMPYSIPSGIP